MRILGIDPGFGRLGWAVIEGEFEAIAYGVIETSASQSLDERLFQIYTSINSIIAEHKPECAAIERLYFTNNTKTAMDVAKSIGVILLTIRIAGLGYFEYSPLSVKQTITGYGKASKEQIKHMVMKLFKITELPDQDDTVDALAIAACHYISAPQRSMHCV